MSDTEIDAKQIEKKVNDLADAMERVRDDQASRDDVVVEMKQAGKARLELLAQDLQPVFKDIPDDNDQFEFALTNGEPSRLWIDMTSFVRMGREKRSYEFVKDTRMGRTILGKSEDRERMARIVTNYVAERMLERERMIEGEWVSLRDYDFDTPENNETATQPVNGSAAGMLTAFGWLASGLVLGAAAMVAWAWFGEIPTFLQ